MKLLPHVFLHKKVLATIWLLLIGVGIASVFWYNAWQYSLPTPVPQGYKPVARGQYVKLNQPGLKTGSKPVFIHFFNPACPCSKFNIATFKALVQQYRYSVKFAVVVMTDEKYSVKQIQDKLGVDVPVYFDQAIAKTCGVYSTPQAVLINADGMLYYRGNYNISRYCADERTNFAKIALNGILDNNNHLALNPLALRAYGCSLPGCSSN